MPQPYEAHLGGIYGSGQYPKQSGAPDWASIAQAISGGASSLLQNAYTRKMGQARLELERRRLDQEAQLHQAQLNALTAYRTATLGNAQTRIAAPGAKAQQQQKQAFTTLLKEDPQNELIKPDESGNPAEFDPNANYVVPLNTVMRTKQAAAAETARHADALDTLQKSGQLRATLQKSGIILRAGAAATKPLTPAQQQAKDAKDKALLLTEIGNLSGGDKVKAHALIANDPDIARAADKLKIGGFEVDAAAVASGKNAGSTSTSVQTIDPKTGAQTTNTVRKKTPPVGPITPLKVQNGQVTNTGASVQPTAIPKLNITPVPTTPVAPPTGAPTKPIPEQSLSDAALWEVKRVHGLTPDQATAYVKNRVKTPAPVTAPVTPLPVVAPKPPIPEEEPAPSGV